MPDFGGTKTLLVTSTAFQQGQPIPAKYTCSGADVSPPLAIGNIPPNAKCLALICDDPDAPKGTWLHWTAWNMPPTMKTLREGVQNNDGAYREGVTDNKSVGYGGPCPPPGKPHRYFFKVYALNATIDLPNGSKWRELEDAMNGKVLAWGELMGTFKR